MKLVVTNNNGEQFALLPSDLGLSALDVINCISKRYGEYAYYDYHKYEITLVSNAFHAYLKVKNKINQVFNIPLYQLDDNYARLYELGEQISHDAERQVYVYATQNNEKYHDAVTLAIHQRFKQVPV